MDNKELQTIIGELPRTLRSFLEAELAAGNEIAEVGHSFPAPPNGIYIMLKKPVSTPLDKIKGKLIFRERNSSLYSGEFTDSNQRFFILTPPKQQLNSNPTTDSEKLPNTASEKPIRIADSEQLSPVSPLQRFVKSMNIDYEKWHDGIGYDIEAIRLASPAERKIIEQMLIKHYPRDWRDIEAIAEFHTKNAQEAIKNAMKDSNPDVRVAITRYAPKLVTDNERSQSIINALQTAEIFSGLSQVLDDIEEYHPQEVKEALINGLLSRKGDIAVLFAAMLLFLYGKAKDPFDMAQRPFFLHFNTESKEERVQAFRELCKQLNINAEKYLS